MTPLEESKKRAGKIDRTLELGTPQTEACFSAMEDLEGVLADTRIYCLMHLGATAHYSGFEVMRDTVTKIRDATFKIIDTIGDLARDIGPIYLSAELLDNLATHIDLSRNLAALRQQPVPIGNELDDLRSSRTRITTAFDEFASSTKLLFTRLKNENTTE